MKRTTQILIAISIFMLGLSSCSQYDEGPSFTLASKKARLVNDWMLYSQTGSDGIENFASTENPSYLTINENGSGTTEFSIIGAVTVMTIEWRFTEEKDCIEFRYCSPGTTIWTEQWDSFEIIQLGKDNLKINDQGNIMHYKTK